MALPVSPILNCFSPNNRRCDPIYSACKTLNYATVDSIVSVKGHLMIRALSFDGINKYMSQNET